MGVAALLEAADLVVSGAAPERPQDDSAASYEGWCRAEAARINWHNPVDQVYNLIRGCNPAPGAWTVYQGKKLQLFDARKHPARKFADVRGKVGTITAVEGQSLFVMSQGGQIEVSKVRYADGRKIPAAQFCADHGVARQTSLGQ